MAEKSLQTRIQLKYDSYENWLASDLVLKAGEAAICTVPTGTTADGVAKPPATLMKIGSGSQKFSELPWLQATAANIYSWAAQPEKPSYSAAEITGLADFISGEIEDTDTTYQLVAVAGSAYTYKLQSKPKNGSTWSDVSTINLSAADTRLTALEDKIGEDAVSDQIAAAIGELDYGEVSAPVGSVISSVSQTNGMVSASTRALTEEDIPALSIAKTSGLQDALDGKQAALSFDGTYSSTNKVATQTTVSNAINNLDKADEAKAGQLVSAVSETNGIITVSRRALVEGDIPAIPQSKVSGLADALAGKQDNLEFGTPYNASTNKVATMSDINGLIADLNGAMHFRGKVTGSTFEAAIAASSLTFASGDVVLYGVDEYVYDGTDWHVLGNESIYQLKTDAASDKTTLETAIGKKQDALSFDGTYSSSNKVATVSTVSNAIGKLDKADKAKAGQLVSAVSEENGVITVSRRALVADDIPALAQSKITGLEDALSGKQATLTFDGTYNASTNKAATVSTVTAAINALDKADNAVANQFVTAVKEENGVITVSRARPTAANISGLAAIATSGSTDDLVQGTNTLVLNCGSASTVI